MIALIAHDGQKEPLLKFVQKYQNFFKTKRLVATASTGEYITSRLDFDIDLVPHGPKGGDIVIAAMITKSQIEAVFFFRDLGTCQPHEPDITSLLRMCDIYNVPLALNEATAKLIVQGMQLIGIE